MLSLLLGPQCHPTFRSPGASGCVESVGVGFQDPLLMDSIHYPPLVDGCSSPLPLTHEEPTLQVKHKHQSVRISSLSVLAHANTTTADCWATRGTTKPSTHSRETREAANSRIYKGYLFQSRWQWWQGKVPSTGRNPGQDPPAVKGPRTSSKTVAEA